MKTLIAQLNHVAEYHYSDGRSQGRSPLKALHMTASQFMLTFVTEQRDNRIYLAADGTVIGCRIAGADAIGEGGLGFTGDIAWYYDDLITQTEAARIRSVTVQAIHQAIRTGRLRPHRNPDAPLHQGHILVRRADVEKL